MQVRSPDHDPEILVRTLKRFVVEQLFPVETETKFAFRGSALDGSPAPLSAFAPAPEEDDGAESDVILENIDR